jgi:hypothetical protein
MILWGIAITKISIKGERFPLVQRLLWGQTRVRPQTYLIAKYFLLMQNVHITLEITK